MAGLAFPSRKAARDKITRLPNANHSYWALATLLVNLHKEWRRDDYRSRSATWANL
jgi:hypothetical protein